ncbi:hypothetical protein H4R19_001320 [Coemansia spiralis]|nr:hypothetical protein H4R19_001320 [Coemansia spiralis]
MKLSAVLLILASVVAAQSIDSQGGETVSGGPAAVNHQNSNSGSQTSNSLVDMANKGSNKLSDLKNNSFSSSSSNNASSDNNMINGSTTSTSGNTGTTANGEGNKMGDRRAKRDVVINHQDVHDNHVQNHSHDDHPHHDGHPHNEGHPHHDGYPHNEPIRHNEPIHDHRAPQVHQEVRGDTIIQNIA